MITLAFDSTAKIASVAVADGEKTLALYSIDNGLTHSELLLPMAEDALRALRLTYGDVGLLACSVGPGSFTGVRIGAALVKGIAFGRQIPCAPVSTLEALAENARGLRGLIVPVMDARRDQFYAALFRTDGGGLLRLSPDAALSSDELAALLRAHAGEPVYLVGDGYEAAASALAARGITAEDTPLPLRDENAASVARVGYRMFLAGQCVADRDLFPTYLRMPQAERERLERLQAAAAPDSAENNEK